MGRRGTGGPVEQRARWRRRLDEVTRPYRPRLFLFYSMRAEPGAPTGSDEYRLVQADEESLARLRRTYPKQYPERKYQSMRSRLGSSSEICWLIYDRKDAAVGFCYAAVETWFDEYINYTVRLAEGESFLFDSRVFRQHRGKGANRYCTARRLELMRERGLPRSKAIIARDNHSSRASCAPFIVSVDAVLVYLPRVHRTLQLPVPRLRRKTPRAR